MTTDGAFLASWIVLIVLLMGWLKKSIPHKFWRFFVALILGCVLAFLWIYLFIPLLLSLLARIG